MSKLFPPKIDTSLPAMYDEGEYIIIPVPFQMNPAVAQGDVQQMSMIIKTVATGVIKGTVATSVFTNNIATFKL
jgi:hypothetical protein